MILPWNRKEVYMGFDVQRLGQVLSALNSGHIRYAYHAVNYMGSRNSIIGTAGMDLAHGVMYYVYVHRKDYDQACNAIHTAK
jgi:hypothetical protein